MRPREPSGRYALLLASTTYEDPELQRLFAPSHDVQALADVLRHPKIGNFTVNVVSNKPSSVMQREVATFFSDRAYDDLLLLYFSGHGIKHDDGHLYLAAIDTAPKIIRATSVPDDFLVEMLKTSRSQRQVLFLDCCFGGAFTRRFLAKADRRVDMADRFEVEGPQGYGRVVLTSSTAMQYSFQGNSVTEHDKPTLSVFTGAIVQGLQTGEADLDHDGQISVAELFEFTRIRVRQQQPNQDPTASTFGQTGQIFVASAAGWAKPGRVAERHAVVWPSDLSPWVTVRNQGAANTSPGVAAVTATEISMATQGRPTQLSGRYVFEKARLIEGHKRSEPPDGVTMRATIEAITKYGAPPEATWPYDPESRALPKGSSWSGLDAMAASYRARIYPVRSYRDIPEHLRLGRPILAGFKVYASTWFTPSGATLGEIRAPRKGDTIAGGHAVVVVAFEPTDQSIRFVNSWGEGWGDHGFGSMKKDAFRAMFDEALMWAVEVPRATTRRRRVGFDFGDD